MAGIEDHAVARLKWTLEVDADTLAHDPRHLAQKHAALLAEAGMDELLVISAAEPPGVQPAREGHLHVVAVVTGDWPQLVEGLPVNAGDVGNVFGRLEPPLDPERSHANPGQFRQQI